MSTIQLRNGFSDRNGIDQINKQIQTDEFDQRTRIALVNLIHDMVFSDYNKNLKFSFFKNIITDVFVEFFDDAKKNNIIFGSEIVFKHYIFTSIKTLKYDEVLTLIEYIAQFYANNNCRYFINELNKLFEQEYVGYRFIDNYIVPITDKPEIDAINETLNSPFDVCKGHISKSLGFLSDRENKDYKNSIKESISAVEALCRIITGNDSAVLSDALKQLEKSGLNIHPCLKNAFEKLYSYTSDLGGIRHAEKMFESNVTFEDAKFMLVSCCAFINYLIPKYDSIKRGKQ